MAMLASKSPYPPALSSAGIQQSSVPMSAGLTSRRVLVVPPSNQTSFSPTESEFSDSIDDPDSAKHWDEERVCDWLHTINCGAYEKLFKKNNINGENLLEMDKAVLQEMGIDKIGDRVRLFVSIKKLRTKAYANQKKRNRDSFAGLESSLLYTPASSASPRPPTTANRGATNNKRFSRQYDSYNLGGGLMPEVSTKSSSRPNSPLPEEARVVRQQRYNAISPQDIQRRDPGQGYFPTTPAISSQSARHPGTPLDRDQPQTARLIGHHTRGAGSIDGSLMSSLPEDQDMIRVIAKDGLTKVVKVTDCKTIDEVMRLTLRKFTYREDHERNYCFWTLAGLEPDPAACRRLFEPELWRIIKDSKRPERNRLILRKIHAGEPSEMELQRAADIAMEESAQLHSRALEGTGKRSQLKAQKILGEQWDTGLQYPLSPASFTSNVSAGERERNVHNAAKDLERPPPAEASPVKRRQARAKNDVLRQFFGQRPPSELITSDLTTYFPNHAKEEIDKTARLSLRRSKRLSRVNSRLSVASNLSFASSMKDAPPMPRIEDTWLQNDPSGPKLRVLDRGHSIYRDSVSSSVLEPLQEESNEPNRKSYVSFDSGSDTHVNITDPDGRTTSSYFEDGSTEAGSLREISEALNEDGEEADDDLQSFLAGDSWDDSKWMKGALIGQGSFGSVYLALHTVTGELLAVKQVQSLSPGVANANDAKKKSMIEALKREIGLLRELQHPNIVQYLGCSSSADSLNIFLEYVPGGSVQTMLNSYGALREPLVRSFVRQIVTGLAYLHGRDIVHRDIKGANILVDNKGGIKISDFGISKKMEASNVLGGAGNSKNRPSLQGSVFWMAPEVVKQTKYTRKSDVWSLGCLVIEMMTGSHPYPDCSQLQAIFKIGGSKAQPTIPEGASDEAKRFLDQTFEIDDRDRPDADELLLSPFLNPCT
ncbi:hypothetical protein V498_09718 [Pseudogymnoascus sp. VKM F-4517 (FW-2822)]|nr:hypothetical protein V498_09718 [Pseudogymnoascus sp. VKM F-4517 (FW-2822)]